MLTFLTSSVSLSHECHFMCFCCLWFSDKLMQKTYTILLTGVVVVGKSKAHSSSFSPGCQKREWRRRVGGENPDMLCSLLMLHCLDGWMDGRRWKVEKSRLTVWKTRVSHCGRILLFPISFLNHYYRLQTLNSIWHLFVSLQALAFWFVLVFRGVCRIRSLGFTSSTFPSSRYCCWTVCKALFCSQAMQ